MDLINEDDLQKKVFNPTLDRLQNAILPALVDKLEAMLRGVLDGAHIVITIDLKPKA
jgi:hypothetical protein